MKHRGTVILLVLGAAVAGFLSVGLVRAAEHEPDLGGPIVVTSSPGPSGRPMSEPARTGRPEASSSSPTGNEPGATEPTRAEPSKTVRPTPRKTKAEPVKPPSPRPGGGGDDDDDDDDGGGGDDDD